ncbi:uncharacterized protein HHUB_3503 [Halobacterium hubeiense]|uniref:Uncharacterized protein n=1 Tax=Halobacterium hubeiense TaxID=1407499 RepID=A0A0U5HX48_9EURY|nr:hypothetical protein [Halobacterium hubeiense]CQH61625.1 uncharacterized protein HHUB_3503 [Halobacterium hubeiense]
MSDTELPEFINQDVLLDISTVDVPDEALLRCFVNANKPFLSKSAVAEMTGLSDEGTRKRLNSLVDRGVLLSAEAGRQTNIYWLNDPRSSWPVPSDLEPSLSGMTGRMAETVTRIHRLTTFTILYAGTISGLYLLDWMSSLQVTDGVFELSLNWAVMPGLAFALLSVLFYIGFQTSLLVESNQAWWPTIRQVYRRVVQ